MLRINRNWRQSPKMNFPHRFREQIATAWRNVDLHSLQTRLTAGVIALSALGLGGVAIWTGWKMQQIVIASQKQNILVIADRFQEDVELYNEMVSLPESLQKAIDNRTTSNLSIWVSRPDDTIAARSKILLSPSPDSKSTANQLLAFTGKLMEPQVYEINGSHWLLCGIPLMIRGEKIGTLYAAQDITSEQTMFAATTWTLSIASLLSILVITVLITFYVRRSLYPLRQMSQLASAISAEDLGQARIELNHAPSEVKELAQMWDKMLMRLSEAWELQRQFVGNVSHELRTPLTIVHGYLQSVLRRGDNLTDLQREALEVASAEADRTIRLLQDLLDLARADSGYLHFQLEIFSLNELIAEIIGMAEKYSNRAIVVEANKNPIWVKADQHRLQQALINLIDNAVKYSDSDTPITLKLEQTAEQAIIQVCDLGYGIPLQHQARIFEPFYRVDEARSRSTGGTGLGLSIVKTLIEGMGGSVSVRSQLGKGSVFTIALFAPQ
jgi:signal transduction histidine kinase